MKFSELRCGHRIVHHKTGRVCLVVGISKELIRLRVKVDRWPKTYKTVLIPTYELDRYRAARRGEELEAEAVEIEHPIDERRYHLARFRQVERERLRWGPPPERPQGRF